MRISATPQKGWTLKRTPKQSHKRGLGSLAFVRRFRRTFFGKQVILKFDSLGTISKNGIPSVCPDAFARFSCPIFGRSILPGFPPPLTGNNAYNVNRLLFQHLPLDLREKRDSSVADLHGQVNPETNSNSFFTCLIVFLSSWCFSFLAIIDVMDFRSLFNGAK